jgi:hypothetical protein
VGVSTPLSVVGVGSESERLRGIARRAREEILSSGEGGVAMAARMVGDGGRGEEEAGGGAEPVLGEEELGLVEPAPQPELGLGAEGGSEETDEEEDEDEDEEEEEVASSTSTLIPRWRLNV